jgi:uncharacterized integral membrane protein (TIGR00697 family)
MRDGSLRNLLEKTELFMSRSIFGGVVAMAIVVFASNILVQFLFGSWLTWGAFTYPFAFLVTDLMNRLHGPGAARRVVLAGFLVGLACSLIGTQIEGAFGPLVSLRVALASGIAFLSAQMIDVAVFDRLRQGRWWRAPLVSSLIGGAVDTALFFSIAFAGGLAWIAPWVDVAWANEVRPLLGRGPEVPLWVSLGVADFAVKVSLAMIVLVPFRLALRRLAAG